MKKDKIKQIRATFEDVGNNQDKIRMLLDEYIENNHVLDKKEREYFIKRLRYATFGLGTQYRFMITGTTKNYDLRHVEHAAYWIAYQTHPIIKLGDDTFKISELWRMLRDKLFHVFPHALEASLKISKEQTHLGPSNAGGV